MEESPKKLSHVESNSTVRLISSDTRAVELVSIIGSLVVGIRGHERIRKFGYSGMIGTLASSNCLGEYAKIQGHSDFFSKDHWSAVPNGLTSSSGTDADERRICGRLWDDYGSIFKNEAGWIDFVDQIFSASTKQKDKSAGKQTKTKKELAKQRKFLEKRRLEWLTIPFDGSIDLQNGESGVATIVAAAPPGTFHDYFSQNAEQESDDGATSAGTDANTGDDNATNIGSDESLPQAGFLVFTGNTKFSDSLTEMFDDCEHCKKSGTWWLELSDCSIANSEKMGEENEPNQSESVEEIDTALENDRDLEDSELEDDAATQTDKHADPCLKLLKQIIDCFTSNLEGADRPLSVGVGIKPPFLNNKVLDHLFRKCRIIPKYGSPVAGAVTAQVGNLMIDGFVSVVDPVQAAIIAACSLTMENRTAVFVPVQYKRGRSAKIADFKLHDKYFEDNKVRVFSATDLVAHNDLFVSIAGVTDSSLLKGVRYMDGGQLQTHVLTLRRYSRSSRFISNRHDTHTGTHKRFRMHVNKFNPPVENDHFGKFWKNTRFYPAIQLFDLGELKKYVKGVDGKNKFRLAFKKHLEQLKNTKQSLSGPHTKPKHKNKSADAKEI